MRNKIMENSDNFHPLEILMQDGEYVEFLVEFKKEDNEYSVEFNIYEVSSWDAENNEALDSELYLRGIIKWDGCSHVYFGNGDGYLHLCGKKYFEQHKKVLDTIWDMSSKRIRNFDNEIAS